MLKPEAYKEKKWDRLTVQGSLVECRAPSWSSLHPCCSGIASSMTPSSPCFGHYVQPFRLWTTVHTSQMCKLPILSVFFIPSRFTTTSLVYLHRFTDSSLEFSTVQSCPCLVPLPLTCSCPCSYACNLNPCMAPNRTPWQDSIISGIIFVSHSLQSGALPLCLGDRQPIPSA